MSATLDRIIEEVRTLSPEEQRYLRQMLDREARSVDEEERNRLASGIRGKYRDVLSSSAAFAPVRPKRPRWKTAADDLHPRRFRGHRLAA